MPAGIAAMRPIAVAMSASEMYGATTEIVALCMPPSAWNELMMPQTVPSRPMYGLVLLTVARNARLCSSRSISLRCETRIARREPSMICSGLKRSEEHTSELQSQSNLVCRLLLEKKNERTYGHQSH